MASSDEDLELDVDRAISAALERGATSFYEVLGWCEGADPRLVAKKFAAITTPSASSSPGPVARRETSELAALFPAADPVGCQWWFTLDTIERLATRVYQAARPRSPVAFIGVPTVGFQYSRRFGNATVLDVDRHVIEILRGIDTLNPLVYDVSQEVPNEHRDKYSAVLVDPPWYPEILHAFFHRAFEIAEVGGSILCSLPPRLTRPGIVDERQALLRTLLDAGLEVVVIEPSATRYLVPEFERVALSDITELDGRPWRSGDLLHVRKKSGALLNGVQIPIYNVTPFARNTKHYRVFIRALSDPDTDAPTWVSRDSDFERTISRRRVDPARLHWWTSDKRGGRLRDPELAQRAISLWADGASREETIARLVGENVIPLHADSVCRALDEHLLLWDQHGADVVRARLATSHDSVTRSDFAVEASKGRPYPKQSEDGYRTPFQRDRDRIIWSRGLRQLSGKTQVFPLASDDFLRNRLAHSLEVMQLAATIGASFGLNPSLIEAGALAHDIGHTPFGHAGEDALDNLFAGVTTALGGFNHYEHGVDVVRWLEDAYQSPAMGGLPGLNITSEVAECIFKHTYCQSGDRLSQEEIYKRSKHQSYFDRDLCHVEGQAVRIADKVSYLISDIEDGIRVGVLHVDDLLTCRLLRRPPIDLVLTPGETLHERFLSQRGLLISILMEDIIESTGRRLARMGSLASVRKASTYAVDHSDELRNEVSEVWYRLQAGKLHTDARVRMANLRAARIVRELTLLFAVAPELVDSRFTAAYRRLISSEYMTFYRSRAGVSVKLKTESLDFVVGDGGRALGFKPGEDPLIPIEQFILAKDYVAGLSDGRARAQHRELLGG